MLKTLHINSALLPTGWAKNVRVSIAANGNVEGVECGIPGAAAGCLLPGMANLHSHAHQRAMAGLAEKSGDGKDSFWTWRSTMYRFLEAIQPHHLHAIAAQLYVEMLRAGYTRVAEFQYLHHQPDGARYDNIAEMSLQTLAAAREVGLGITNLPVHYQFGGFGARPIAAQQRRFANGPEQVLRIVDTLGREASGDANVVTGIAAHSLRAISRECFAEVLGSLNSAGALPTHIHIAEQIREVDECLDWSKARPVEYLLGNYDVDINWCLVHATHMTDAETRGLAASGAVAGLCPTTEANLGDGFFNATPYLDTGGALGIGSDSHISISPTEELRWLEYGQRLLHRSRNRLAGGPRRSTGRNLFDRSVAGGARACGHASGAIEAGRRADFIVLDCDHPLLCERQEDDILDSWIFSGNQNCVRDVIVGGKQVVSGGRHANETAIAAAFRSTLRELRGML